MQKKVIIFDFDGTIADTVLHIFEIGNKILADFHRPILTKEEFNELREFSPQEIIKKLKVPLFSIPLLLKRANDEFGKIPEKVKPVSGMPKVLTQLKQEGYQLGIISSNSKKNIESFLKINELDFFDFVHSESNIFGKGKALKHFLLELNISSHDAVYVGDEIRDIKAAQENNIDIASVTWGFNTQQSLQKYNQKWVISDPNALLALFN